MDYWNSAAKKGIGRSGIIACIPSGGGEQLTYIAI